MSGKEPEKLKEKPTSLKEVADHDAQRDESAPEHAEALKTETSMTASSPLLSAEASTTEAQPDHSKSKADEPMPQLDDCYEIIAVVGKGGMGSVYKVYQKGIDRTLAIKILQPSLAADPVALKRFEQEVDSASKLSHPNLAAVYGHGKTKSGAPYLVMDYLDGESLSSFLKRIGTVDPKRALAIFAQIASALAHAHENSVIHRDIKPTNIIITVTADGVDKAHIVDFGIAKVMPTANRETHDLTETGEVFGSPHYMSPEQCLGFMLDERSDVYSFGCLMYEVLTGEPPFGGANPIQVVVKHINEEAPQFADEFRRDTTAIRLEDVVMKCLEKDKSQRYQSVNELIKDLNLIAAGKSPPKYVRQKEPKKELTKRGTIGLVVGVIIAIFYFSVIGGMSGNGLIIGQILAWVAVLLLAGGAYSFIMAFLEKVRKIRAGKNHENEWWQALLMGALSSACLTIYPTVLAAAVSVTTHWIPPPWAEQYVGYTIIAHGISVTIAAVAALGCLLFRNKKTRGTVPRIAVEFIALSASIFITAFYVVPDGTASVAYTLSQGLTRYSTPIGTAMLQLAAYLGKDNTQPVLEYANKLVGDKKYNEAIDVLTRAIERADRPTSLSQLLSKRAEIYADCFKDFEKFYADLRAAIASDGSSEVYKQRARQLEKQGKYREAIADLSSAILKTNDLEVTLWRSKLWLAAGDYQKAITDADTYIEKVSWQPPAKALLLRAKAYQLLGNKALADADYQLITQVSTKPFGYSNEKTPNLVLAYAFNQLGNMSECEKYLGLAKASDQQTKQMLNKYLEVPGIVLNLFTWN